MPLLGAWRAEIVFQILDDLSLFNRLTRTSCQCPHAFRL